MVIIIRKLGSLQDPQVFRPWTFRIASREAFRRGVYLTPPIASRRSAIACDDNTFSISSGCFYVVVIKQSNESTCAGQIMFGSFKSSTEHRMAS
jgi:hypothetical protein